MEKYLRIGAFLLIGVILYGAISLSTRFFSSATKNKELECFGVIQQIKIDDNHSTPSFLIDGDWRYLGLYGVNIRLIVQEDDSVAKSKGKSVLFLYRKDSKGLYNLLAEVEPRKITRK